MTLGHLFREVQVNSLPSDFLRPVTFLLSEAVRSIHSSPQHFWINSGNLGCLLNWRQIWLRRLVKSGSLYLS